MHLHPSSIALKLMVMMMMTAATRYIQTGESDLTQAIARHDTIVTDMMTADHDKAGHNIVFCATDRAILHTNAPNIAAGVVTDTSLPNVARIETTYSVVTVVKMAIWSRPVFQRSLADLQQDGVNDDHVILCLHPVQDLQMKEGVDPSTRVNADVTRRDVADLDLAPLALTVPRLLPSTMGSNMLSPKPWYMHNNNICHHTITQ